MKTKFDLKTKIKTLICYSHVFDCPLSEKELLYFCNNYKKKEVKKILYDLEIDNHIIIKSGHIILRKHNYKNIIETKRVRFSNSKKIINENQTILKILLKIPFILMVGITGAVAHSNTLDKIKYSPDLDLFIVSKNCSLHLVRFIMIIIRRFFELLNFVGISKKRISIDPNYGLEAGNLSVNIKSFFTAYEASSVKILKGNRIYNSFINENKWIYAYLNPKKLSEEHNTHVNVDVNASFVVRALNYLCFLFFLVLNSAKHFIFGFKKTYSFEEGYDHTFNKIQQLDGGYQTHIASRLKEIYDAEFGENKLLHCFLFPKIKESGSFTNGNPNDHLTKKLNYD